MSEIFLKTKRLSSAPSVKEDSLGPAWLSLTSLGPARPGLQYARLLKVNGLDVYNNADVE